MIDLDKAVEGLMRAFPGRDEDQLRDTVSRLVSDVRRAPPTRGDYRYHSTWGVCVEQRWHADAPEPDGIYVYAEIASDFDHGELI